MKHTNLITAVFLALSLAMASCASEEPLIDPTKDVLRSYEFTMFDSQNDLSFSLADISTPVARVESPFNWLDISQGDNDESGFTRIHIARTKPTPEGFDSDDAYLYLSDNKVVKLTITSEGNLVASGNNSEDYENFNTQWWKEESIKFKDETSPNGINIPLPWASSTTTNIPYSISQSEALSKESGWRMAYNLFSATVKSSDGSYVPKSKPYFALYNKFTGILRIFYYQNGNTGTGGELAFAVTPDAPTSQKFPFYNSLQYAIPVSHTDIPQKGNILNIVDGNSVFQQLYTPYLASAKSAVLQVGWYCFDIDMSAYNPAIKTAFSPEDRLTIVPQTSNNASITLAGAIEGTSSGTITDPERVNTSTSSNKGQSFIDVAKTQINNAKEVVAAVKKKDYLAAVVKGCMSVYNFGKAVFSSSDNSETTTKYEPPTIELAHNGTINLSGYSTSPTSSSAVGVQFAYNSFTVNEKDNVCEGVWSLKSDPVVYVVSDYLYGDKPQLNLLVNENGYINGASDPAEYNLRLMTFLDPRSLEVNLNTKAFKDIRNIKLSYTYGVYPNQPHGHTDLYRKSLLDLKVDKPVFITKNGNVNKFYKSSSSTFANMKYIHRECERELGFTPQFYSQKGAKYRYAGQPGNSLPYTDKDFFVANPMVLLPTDYIKQNSDDEYGQGWVYDFEAPDFVVGVMLTFDFTAADGTTDTAVFSKRFIPTVKAISAKDAVAIEEDIQERVSNMDFLGFWYSGDFDDTKPEVAIADPNVLLRDILTKILYLKQDLKK